ncbi:Predicted nucleic acid-binding protein, contains PIN domain [Haladaptatus litoreus]|uniref:Predicted nucleic acid-binding protein, contains PIN domain n=1 Tax=Haladaptatus litoreus TaxID=553468 RepID=A0A1N7DDQ3_9EURY|nr:DUF3368 domain-containing protein [Haladaptatus litoreus]SIR73887.1 Predicted nucleic acid-binding protein, contains PIN domain [Haladaptatus litoreus]
MWVFDATPLIYLAKADALSYLRSLAIPRYIPEAIYEEVVTKGLDHDYPDARRIERAVDANTFKVVSVEETPLSDRLRRNPNLSDADVDVLVLAVERDSIAVMDEQYGRDVAATEEIPTRGTAYLLLSLVKEGTLTTDEARRTIDAMLDSGWYCAPNLYAQIIAKLDTLS